MRHLFPQISLRVLSKVSKAALLDMVHSSQTMSLHWLRTSARAAPLEMLQVGASARDRLMGSLKTECAVLPPKRRVAAIPEEATASTMRLFCRTAARRLITKEFPVPPGASRKKRHPRFVSTMSIILLYAAFWSSTNLDSFSAINSASSLTL